MKSRADLAFRISAGAVITAQAALALAIFRFGPTHSIAMHFGLNGHVDRWGDRTEAALVTAAMAAFSILVLFGLAALSERRISPDQGERTTRRGLVIVLGVTSAICLIEARLVWVSTPPSAAAAMAIISAIFLGLGGLMGKVRPNPLIGIRTPWTFASRLAWDKANRLCGRLFFWGGLVGLTASPLAPQPLGLQATFAGAIGTALLSVFESWRVWRTDPDRRGAI